MSRYLTLVLTGVSAVALTTLAAPTGQAASGTGQTHLTPVAGAQTHSGDRKVGSWCC